VTYGVYATGVEDYGSTPAWAGSTPVPLVAVEVAFTTNPGAAPVWVNLGERVKGFTVHRGRADELSAFNAGQATITLNNEDRAFDPVYTASPYYPNVVPMRRIRIRATYAAATYDVFNGYVTNWQQQYSPPQDADAVVECTDAFKVLGNVQLLSSVYESEVRADTPTFWWRLNEAAGSTSILDAIGGRVLTPFGSPTLGAAGLVTRDSGTALSEADVNTGFANRGTYFQAGALPDFSIEAIVKTATQGVAFSLADVDSGVYITIGTEGGGTGKALLRVYTTIAGSGTSWTAVGTTTLTDNNPHHIVGTWTAASATPRIYVDGVLETVGASGNNGTIGANQEMVVGNLATGYIPTGHTSGIIGTTDEAALYVGTALTAARIAAHASARATPWNGDLTGTRIGRILDAAGWPAADRNIDAGTSTLQSSDVGGTALTALQAVEQTEFGALFVTAGGQVRFISRYSLLTAPYITAQATFGDSGTELEFGDLTFEYDDKLIFNEAQVSRSGGTVQIVADATSQAKYLRRTKVVGGLLHQSDSTSLDAANWIVNHYKDPLLRVTGLLLEPSAGNDATHFPQVLGRELIDRVTINRRPQNLGAAISQDSQIQGITHQVNMKTGWVTRWDLSPAETQVYWILGTAGFSELEQTTRLGF